MEKITFMIREKDLKAKTRVRFRLRDGRDLQLFHSTGIVTTVGALKKFQPNGELASGVKTYDRELREQIVTEYKLMTAAFEQMKDEGMDMTSEFFEQVIEMKRNPIEEVRENSVTIVERFRQYVADANRDGIIGDRRMVHITVVIDKLYRFLTIKGQSQMTPQEFDERWLMDFRNFIFDEYKYVDKHKRLYKNIKEQNRPTVRLSMNTVTSQMKMLQTFLNELENNDEINKSPFRKLGKERKKAVMKTMYDEPFFLRKEELQKVMKAKIPPFLESARDAFLVQCAIGCRIGDFQKFNMDKVAISEDGIPYVHYIPHKTADKQMENTEVITPLVRFAFDIIKRTNFNLPVLKNIYGTMGYNTKIKSLLSCCKIDRKVAQYDESAKENVYLPLYEVASSKLCRKTHVDMMNKVQIDMYAAGLHKQGSAAVTRYTALELKDRFALINLAFGQEPYRVDTELNIIGE